MCSLSKLGCVGFERHQRLFGTHVQETIRLEGPKFCIFWGDKPRRFTNHLLLIANRLRAQFSSSNLCFFFRSVAKLQPIYLFTPDSGAWSKRRIVCIRFYSCSRVISLPCFRISFLSNSRQSVAMYEVPYKSLEEAQNPVQNEKLCERKNMKRLVMPFMCLLMVCVVTWVSFPALDVSYRLPMSESRFLNVQRFKND